TAGMIWSVSTLLRRSGTPMPVGVVKASMAGVLGRAGQAPGGRSEGGTGAPRSDGEDSVPRTAVAAATTGETRWVRPPLPCRPSKLRLEVEAARSPGASWSGFIPRHMEHPAWRHSAPKARNTDR